MARRHSRILSKTEYNRLPLVVIKRTYHNIVRRTSGLDPKTPRTHGMPLGLTQDEFIQWTCSDATFLTLFQHWAMQGYARRYAPSIDRLDDWQGYVPGNLRWVVWHANQAKPHARSGRLLTFNGRTHNLIQWSRQTGIKVETLIQRLRYRWSVERALTTPVQKQFWAKQPRKRRKAA